MNENPHRIVADAAGARAVDNLKPTELTASPPRLQSIRPPGEVAAQLAALSAPPNVCSESLLLHGLLKSLPAMAVKAIE
jgi:hypothetical protein